MKESTIPKYQAVHDAILARLMAGHYSVGTRLPTEGALSEAFDVSRVTIRKALELLVRAGFLTAKQGSGYVVATVSPATSTCMASFTDQVLNQGRIPGAQLLSLENPTAHLNAEVDRLFDEPLILIQRLRTIDGLPRMFTQTWVPVRHAPKMSAADFPETGQEQSILRILRHEFNVDWTSACETVDSVSAAPQIAERLDVVPDTPILSQACTAFDTKGQPVFFDQVYRQGPINFDLSNGTTQQTSA